VYPIPDPMAGMLRVRGNIIKYWKNYEISLLDISSITFYSSMKEKKKIEVLKRRKQWARHNLI